MYTNRFFSPIFPSTILKTVRLYLQTRNSNSNSNNSSSPNNESGLNLTEGLEVLTKCLTTILLLERNVSKEVYMLKRVAMRAFKT